MDEVSIEHVLALITQLKQLCNFGPGGESAKMDDLVSRLDELTAAGHKALVFTQYIGDDSGARRIAARLRRFSPLVFTGEQSLPERSRVIEQFQRDDHGVLILSLRAGGVGLNLQCASYVFHFDRWWNPAVERQAEDRTHRLGQTQPVHVYRYQMTDTIEQRINEVLLRKRDLFTNLVDATSLDPGGLLSKQELFELMGLEVRESR
jgi:SNF2 family DNA or RNA helicase